MTMLAKVARRHDRGVADPYGAPQTTLHEAGVASFACFVQPRTERTITGDGKLVVFATAVLWAPLDSDLSPEDVVTEVTNRAGRVIDSTRRRVVGIVRRETHIEAMLEAYGG